MFFIGAIIAGADGIARDCSNYAIRNMQNATFFILSGDEGFGMKWEVKR